MSVPSWEKCTCLSSKKQLIDTRLLSEYMTVWNNRDINISIKATKQKQNDTNKITSKFWPTFVYWISGKFASYGILYLLLLLKISLNLILLLN